MSSRQEFEKACNKLHEKITHHEQSISIYESVLEKALADYKKNILESIPSKKLIPHGIKLSKPDGASAIMEESLQDMRTQLSLHCDKWFARIEANKRNMEFRKDFGDSLLVYVYGKVKSGKSSLGNYVAHGKTLSAKNDYASENCASVEFGVKDIAQNLDNLELKDKLEKQRAAMENEKKFLVDFFEATACIQYFKKHGLTWVDSPGIHSLTVENGKLAEEYLNSADIVLFTSKAQCACTEIERKELCKIISSGKPYLLLLTQCDDIELDEDENGNVIDTLVMKSDEDQQEIIHWSVCSIGNDLNMNEEQKRTLCKRILPISCLYAEKENETGSGMDEFFNILLEVMESEGTKEKVNAPLRATLSHIAEIEKDIKNDQDTAHEVRCTFDKLKKRLDDIVSEEKFRCQDKAEEEHHSLLVPYLHDRNHHAFQKIVQQKADELVSEGLKNIVQKFQNEFAEDLKNLAVEVPLGLNLAELKDKMAPVVRHDNSGSNFGTTAGSIIGGLCGLLLGPIGAVVAGIGGSLVGRKLGSYLDDDITEYESIGTNVLEVEKSTISYLKEYINVSLNNGKTKLNDMILTPPEKSLSCIEKELVTLMNVLKLNKNYIEKEIEQ